jgi:hypothetical protein
VPINVITQSATAWRLCAAGARELTITSETIPDSV